MTLEKNQDDTQKRPLSALPKEIQQHYKSIQTLRTSTDKNALTRDAMNT